MICGNNYQGIFIFFCKIQCCINCFIKVFYFFNDVIVIVCMAVLVNLRVFYYQKEFIFVFRKKINSYGGSFRQKVVLAF